ncbi:MAG: tetratricopeptide repeat protein [Kiritimatiellia bacterium]
MSRLFQSVFIAGLLCLSVQGLSAAEPAPSETRRLADGLYARGIFDLALEEYQKLLNGAEPSENKDLLYYRAGESASRLGKWELAATYFEQAVASGGTGISAQRSRYRLAEKAYELGDLDRAETLLRSLQLGEVDATMDAPVRFTLARILEAQNQKAEALRLYRAFLTSYPDDPLSAYAALQVAALSDAGIEEKRAAYKQALKNPPSREFEVEALWSWAVLERTAGNARESADLFWKLWSQFPDSSRVRAGMIHLAWAQLQAGEAKRALLLANQTSESRKEPDADTWLYLEGVSHDKLGESAASVSAFETLLKRFPESRFRRLAVYELAESYAALGEFQKVLEFSQDLQQIPGREVEALWLLAESSRGAGETRQALQTYTRIAHQYPRHPKAADALYFKAVLLLKTGEAEAAAEALTVFALRMPEDPRAGPALEQAGDLLVKAGKREAGLRKWLQALENSATPNPPLLFKIAMLEIRLEKFADAGRRLESYLEADLSAAQRAEALYWQGVLFDRIGETMAARTALEAALQVEGLKQEWQFAARMRLGQSYSRSGESARALEVFLPLLGTGASESLSDELLLWLGTAAETEGNLAQQKTIAQSMIQQNRRAATRELGFYALAGVERKQGNAEAGIQALQKGLAFQSESVEAVSAHLDLADLLLTDGEFKESFHHYSEAARMASSLELGQLQARGIMGNGRVRMAEKKWPEAAKYFMSVAVLFEDPELSPEALRMAEKAFRLAGQTEHADAALQEFQKRYPEQSFQTP